MRESLETLVHRLNGLPDYIGEIKDGVRKAIQVAPLDADMALTRVRKVLEHVVRDVYQRRCNEDPGTRPLENLIQRLVKDGHFPTRLDAYATGVRKLGNVGTHSFSDRVTAEDVYQSLTQLLPVLEWYFECESPSRRTAPPEDSGKLPPSAQPRECVHPRSAVDISPPGAGNADNLMHLMWDCLDPSLFCLSRIWKNASFGLA